MYVSILTPYLQVGGVTLVFVTLTLLNYRNLQACFVSVYLS